MHRMVLQDLGKRLNTAINSLTQQSAIDEQVRSTSPILWLDEECRD